MILDATDLLVGRFATKVAKAALLGEEVHIVNAEKAMISGNPVTTVQKFTQRRERGAPLIGPYYPKQSHLIVKRMIRGMIDYKSTRGKAAFSRIKCYRGVPSQFEGKEMVRYEDANISKLPVYKYTPIEKISAIIGGNK